MSELQIKTESLPARCGICHQSDCFDAATNHCARCAGVPVTVPSAYSNSPVYLDAVNDSRFLRSFGLFSIIGTLLNFLGSYLGLGVGLVIWRYGKTTFYQVLAV